MVQVFYWNKPGVYGGPRRAAVAKGHQSDCPPSPSGPLFLLAEDNEGPSLRHDNEKLGFTAGSAGLGAQLSSVQKILPLIQN